jgi:hypothetical protein
VSTRRKEPQVPPLTLPEFRVESGGAAELHAALSTESRTRVVASSAKQEIRVRSGRDAKFCYARKTFCVAGCALGSAPAFTDSYAESEAKSELPDQRIT